MSSNQEDAVYFYMGSSPQFQHEDKEAAKFGMWLFLYTEMLLFGVLFLAYAAYRTIYTSDFVEASSHLNRVTGTVNTFVLLFSSLTTVLAIVAMQKGKKMLSASMIIVTILCAFVFLTIKGFEWKAKIEHGIYLVPNSMSEHAAQKMLPGNAQSLPYGQMVFFGLYYVMTGLHALHVIVGIVFFLVILVFVFKDIIHKKDLVFLENSSLYWHIVDLVWTFLFPLFYLIM